MKCPRTDCDHEAQIDMTYGILPCLYCQAQDEQIAIGKPPEFYNLSKINRIQDQRDQHGADLIQPWLPGKDMAPNPDFIKQYPDQASTYFTPEQLSKL